MLKLILDQDYRTAIPAVDHSEFSNHGRVLHVSHSPDGVSAGSGALTFDMSGSAVRIAARPCWQDLGSLAVEAWIRCTGTGSRRNILEGDGSFALFIDTDDTLVASFFGLEDGSSTPDWHTVASAAQSPGGIPHRIQIGQWHKVFFQHDGITRARVFIDDRLVAVRGDFRSGVVSVDAAGIVVGNWTLSDQFAFKGQIDRVRVWKRDKHSIARDFASRPITPAARDYWDTIFECLLGNWNSDQRGRLAALSDNWTELLREFFRAVHAGSDADRDRLLAIIEAYRANWLSNAVSTVNHVDTVAALVELIGQLLGPTWMERARVLAEAIAEFSSDSCIDPGRLAELDPEFAEFVRFAGDRFR